MKAPVFRAMRAALRKGQVIVVFKGSWATREYVENARSMGEPVPKIIKVVHPAGPFRKNRNNADNRTNYAFLRWMNKPAHRIQGQTNA